MQDVRVEPSSPVLAAHHSEDCCSSTVMNVGCMIAHMPCWHAALSQHGMTSCIKTMRKRLPSSCQQCRRASAVPILNAMSLHQSRSCITIMLETQHDHLPLLTCKICLAPTPHTHVRTPATHSTNRLCLHTPQGPPSPTAQHGRRDHRWSPEQLRKAGVQPKTTSFEDPGLGTGPMSGPLLHRSVLSTSVDVASGSLSAGPYSATNVAVTVPHKVRNALCTYWHTRAQRRT